MKIEFKLENFNLLMIVDVVAVFLLAAVFFFFFKRRHNLKLYCVFLGLIAAYIAFWLLEMSSSGYAFVIAKTATALLLVLFTTATVIVYQSDFKAIFKKFSVGGKRGSASLILADDELRLVTGEIVKACQNLSKNDVGALIVITPGVVPTHIVETGTEIGGKISAGLLESIFKKGTPLHDGAVMIKDDRILAAGCFLPLSENVTISKDLGTRHRAALGVTEDSDVLAIVVSEETGVISTARAGKFRRYMTPEKLSEEILSAYGISYAKPIKDKKA